MGKAMYMGSMDSELRKARQDRRDLVAVAQEVLTNNGGPIDSDEGPDTYVMVKIEDFNALADAVKRVNDEASRIA